jgi:hypothetical protein
MFTQVTEKMKQLGIFGNAKISYEQDWISLISENVDGITSPSEKNGFWDQETLTCFHATGLEL